MTIKLATAKIAKEKEFNLKVTSYASLDEKYDGEVTYYDAYGYPYNWNIPTHTVSLPTQSELQRWLREEHDIHIEISRQYERGFYLYEYHIAVGNSVFGFSTYEEALEEGLIKALELI